MAGGYVLTVVAPNRPMLHTIPLLLWLCFETTFLFVTEVTAGPLWFDIVSGGSLVVGVIIGAFIFTRLGSTSTQEGKAEPSVPWFSFFNIVRRPFSANSGHRWLFDDGLTRQLLLAKPGGLSGM